MDKRGEPALELGTNMDGVAEQLVECMRQGQAMVLATIVRVKGSAYRKEGAKMLIGQDGQLFGTLSAGCLEEDVMHRAKEVFTHGKAYMYTYNLAAQSDEGWGKGSGCNGVIDVLLERLDWGGNAQESNTWIKIVKEIEEGQPVFLVRRIDMQSLHLCDGHGVNVHVSTMALSANQQVIGSVGDVHLDEEWTQQLLSFSKNEATQPTEVGPKMLYFLDRLQPKYAAFVFGAGPDARPLVALLAQVGFRVTVVDPRSAYLQEQYFSQASELLMVQPTQAREQLVVPEGTYAFVMTHSFTWDVAWVQFLREQPVRYLGILGPMARTERLFAPDSVPNYVYSPIGLPILAQGPEEIAVSIVAQVVQHRNSRC